MMNNSDIILFIWYVGVLVLGSNNMTHLAEVSEVINGVRGLILALAALVVALAILFH
jgi:uncharacterized membrane protein (DUF485 family)